MTAMSSETRAKIHAILTSVGAPEWMLASCISVEAAQREADRIRAEQPRAPVVNVVAPAESTRGCTTVCIADVVPQRTEWLWEGRIPLAQITLIDGEPGKGKGCITCDLAARVTRGGAMPLAAVSSTPRPAAAVLFMSAEDALAQVIRPRLDVAGADVRRVHAITAMPRNNDVDAPPTLAPEDVVKLEAAIVRHGATLVVIDPLMAFLPANVDAHRDQDVRRVLTPLARVAERTGAAIVIVRHPRKGAGSAMHRGGGSIGIGAAARSVLFVGDDPEDADARIIVGAKENNSRRAPGLRFRVDGVPHVVGEQPRVSWIGIAAGVTADELAAPPVANTLDATVAALRGVLAAGSLSAEKATERVQAIVACSAPTIRRARQQLGVVALQVRGPSGKVEGWTWTLPAAQAHEADHLEGRDSSSAATSQAIPAGAPGDQSDVIAWPGERGDHVAGSPS